MARLAADDWITAAVRVLLTDGPDAVAVQPLARRLGTTKGSFYWHFASRDDLLRAALRRWLQLGTEDVIDTIEGATEDPVERARLLIRMVTEHSLDNPGQLRLLATADHPDVRAALETAARRRIGYVARLLRAAGLPAAVARRRAVLAYSAYLGHAQLADTTPGVLPTGPAARRALLTALTELLFASVDTET
ncbi:MAG TPA: TetR/AcrR family transcriptional regulator [Actinophytocola sp.]|nr:TetR/AcrR family transcriptional regulator [Actinophytocola sp.]